jgi:hypothetical protein
MARVLCAAVLVAEDGLCEGLEATRARRARLPSISKVPEFGAKKLAAGWLLLQRTLGSR